MPAETESTTRRILRLAGSVAAWPLIALVRFYQLFISPLTPPTCRYYPSCSAYALTSLRRFGPIKGTWLAVRRVLRCHPWAPGGVDHVPERVRRAPSDRADASPDAEPPRSGGPGSSNPSPTARRSVSPPPSDKGLS